MSCIFFEDLNSKTKSVRSAIDVLVFWVRRNLRIQRKQDKQLLLYPEFNPMGPMAIVPNVELVRSVVVKVCETRMASESWPAVAHINLVILLISTLSTPSQIP